MQERERVTRREFKDESDESDGELQGKNGKMDERE